MLRRDSLHNKDDMGKSYDWNRANHNCYLRELEGTCTTDSSCPCICQTASNPRCGASYAIGSYRTVTLNR